MKNILYGLGKWQCDFEYVFCNLPVAYYIDNIDCDNVNVFPLDRIKQETPGDYRVIVCKENFDEAKKELEAMGLVYGENFYHVFDLLDSLNENGLTLNQIPKRVVVWGTGKVAFQFRRDFPDREIMYYIDSNTEKAGSEINGIKILSPDQVDDWQEYFIIVAINLCQSVIDYLQSRGCRKYNDFVEYLELSNLPSERMKKAMLARPQNIKPCENVMNFTFVGVGGELHFCCPNMVYNYAVGSLQKQDFRTLWNSPLARIMRLSVVNQTFCFCCKGNCAHLLNEEANYQIPQAENYKMEPPEYPERMILAFDDACNLKCISCRKEFHFQHQDEDARLAAEETVNNLLDIMPFIDWVEMAGNGDPFYSEYYKKLWVNQLKRQSISVVTNGLLFNEKNWELLRKSYKNIYLDFSIDAAVKENYEKIRIGGNFDVLKRNLEFAGELRRKGLIKALTLRFVVEKYNYTDMPEFVRWAKRLGADKVFFTKMANWELFTEEEFNELSMFNSDDTIKPELKEILKDSIFRDEIVDMGNLSSYL